MGYAYVAKSGFQLGVYHVFYPYNASSRTRTQTNIGYNEVGNAWTTYPNAPIDFSSPRVNASASSQAFSAFIIGGGDFANGGTRSNFNTEFEGGPTGAYVTRQFLPAAVERHSTHPRATNILIAGGAPPTGTTSACYIYVPPPSDTMPVTNSLITARRGHGQIDTGAFAYAFGGTNGTMVYDTTEKYDPVSGTWASISATMVLARHAAPHAFVNGFGYVTTGYQNQTNGGTLTTNKFDPSTETWSLVTGANYPSPSGLGFTQAGVLGKRMAVAGGRYRAGSYTWGLRILDAVTETWSYGAQCPFLHGEGAAAVI